LSKYATTYFMHEPSLMWKM